MSRAAWSFVDYGCGHSTPVRGGDRSIAGPCPACTRLVLERGSSDASSAPGECLKNSEPTHITESYTARMAPTYTPSMLTCPGSLVWAADLVTPDIAECPYCQTRLVLEPGDKSGTLPAHDATDDRLPIPAADLEDLIAETQQDQETRDDPYEQRVLGFVFERLVHMWKTTPGCIDPRHGIDEHPCDEVLGRDAASAARFAARFPDDDEPCNDCGRPVYYGTDDRYHHVDPEARCFLIQN